MENHELENRKNVKNNSSRSHVGTIKTPPQITKSMQLQIEKTSANNGLSIETLIEEVVQVGLSEI